MFLTEIHHLLVSYRMHLVVTQKPLWFVQYLQQLIIMKKRFLLLGMQTKLKRLNVTLSLTRVRLIKWFVNFVLKMINLRIFYWVFRNNSRLVVNLILRCLNKSQNFKKTLKQINILWKRTQKLIKKNSKRNSNRTRRNLKPRKKNLMLLPINHILWI